MKPEAIPPPERRAGMKQTPQCVACFNAYCWDGVSNSSTPASEYNPSVPGVNPADQACGAGTKSEPDLTDVAAVLSPLTATFVGVMSGLAVLASSLTVL